MNLFSSFRRKGSLTLSSNWSRRVFSRSESAFGSAFVAFLSSSFKECENARSFSRSFCSKSFRSWELERFSPNACVRTSWRKSGLLLSFLLYIAPLALPSIHSLGWSHFSRLKGNFHFFNKVFNWLVIFCLPSSETFYLEERQQSASVQPW